MKHRYRKAALKAGFRSGLEQDNHDHLKSLNAKFDYEKLKIKYVAKEKTYTPDFELSNRVIVECKGYFRPADRTKHLLIKDQHPELDIRFVFSNPNIKLSKSSKTTYADWCDQHGFKWAQGLIPKEWVK
jgi:hypothetical protein